MRAASLWWLLALVVVVVVMSATIAHAESAEQKAANEKSEKEKASQLKYKAFVQKTAEAQHHVPLLNYNEYKRFVSKAPRNYTTILVAVALDEQFKCGSCKIVLSELGVLADSYYRDLAKADEPEVFFAYVDYRQAPEVFQELGIQFTPQLYHFGKALTAKEASAKPDKTEFKNGKFMADDLAKILKTHTGIQVRVVHPWPWGQILPLAALLGVTLFLSWDHLKELKLQNVWTTLSLGVYFFFISGFMYTVIRGTPFINANNGNPEYVFKSAGSMFGAEAVLVAGFLILASFGLLKLNDPKAQLSYVSLVYLFVFVFGFMFFHNLYNLKSGGYPYRFPDVRSYLDWRHFYKSGPIRG